MKILVCISHVPDTTTKIKFVDNKLDTNGVQFIIGPYDDFALARAVELKEASGGTVTVLNVGTVDTEPSIRKALAIGADNAVRVDAEPTDSLFVAKQIVAHAASENYDMILMGRESSDFNSGLVHGLVGELLGWPSIAPAMKLDVDGSTAKLSREIEGGHEDVEVQLPFVAGCQEPIAEWKIPNMRGIMMARKKPLEVVEAVAVEGVTAYQSFELPEEKGECKMVDADQMDELVGLLKNEARVL
ncbi:electron transfer flavoprotein subunit beta/FixA family protein [Flammeovirga kamogawensis]|uniref:Electron transfer flavoprotein subunit beta n=1 Tax=Flammeovirga kamogawensis TaxID=373891 RepID=A0ABX8GTT7_9BACT|nr:electron transfer flavoprotein subunit beta/FixA family protein [Flammeovirga kamogawensis]MBB6459929.1 electron transfer flavoprotein beta subunit [Flammeovirga kamogawensis]QWG07018.1 electron transfer flavoprotein subunit beta/FixA family protein [Flammeovirga kamogawensis]TRX68839.1 electron transfer flavoprotein subunit beta/FixA family protein [Flammeovirga kamogawensis]